MLSTKHFEEMMIERNIPVELVESTIANPDRIENNDDGTQHYLKQFKSFGNRWLRVVVNVNKKPYTKVTVFFDRRLRRKTK